MQPTDLREPELLSAGGGRSVYRASAEAQTVLLKRFSLGQAGSWKELELFEREARTLQRLDHPGLPRLLAYGCDDTGPWLITEWIPGQSLAEKLESGWRPTEAEALVLARELLELLAWLHDHQPPLVHRDIKPSNLVLAPDNRLHLIDFGSVLHLLRPDGGSTVAGTFGYMAPEQFTGRALPASDLYALGATLVHLLSGRSPAELPSERLRLNFEGYLHCSPDCKRWLETLLAPMPEERYASARQALADFHRLESLGPAGQPPDARPGHSVRPRYPETSERQAPSPVPAPKSVSGEHLEPIRLGCTALGTEITLPERPLPPAVYQREIAFALGGSTGAALLLLNLLWHPPTGVTLAFWLPFLLCALAARSIMRLKRAKLTAQLSLDSPELVIESRTGEFSSQRHRIPRERLRSLELRDHDLRLRYEDVDGRLRDCVLGAQLQPHEQEWLSDQIKAWRRNDG